MMSACVQDIRGSPIDQFSQAPFSFCRGKLWQKCEFKHDFWAFRPISGHASSLDRLISSKIGLAIKTSQLSVGGHLMGRHWHL